LIQVDIGVASAPKRGERISGDLHVFHALGGGVLLAAIDGLGHGEEAANAAQAAAEQLAAHHEPLPHLFDRCHRVLAGTRGVVMSAAIIAESGAMNWLGVGNVEGILRRADPEARPAQDRIPLRGGVVGFRMPALRANHLLLRPNDLLVFATDGIAPGFEIPLYGSPQRMADLILKMFGKGEDDALVLVARVHVT
jgi:hypothetical protein